MTATGKFSAAASRSEARDIQGKWATDHATPASRRERPAFIRTSPNRAGLDNLRSRQEKTLNGNNDKNASPDETSQPPPYLAAGSPLVRELRWAGPLARPHSQGRRGMS